MMSRHPLAIALSTTAAALVLLLAVVTTAAAAPAWERLDPKRLKLRSEAALITDATSGEVVFARAASAPRPIASLTKLMTAIVVLDAGVDLAEPIRILKADRDLIQLTGSRLTYGEARLSRRELLTLALASSENRAAAALGRTTFAGGTEAFVAAMNAKAKALGLRHSHFADPAGLAPANQASPADLVRLLDAASRYHLIREATTTRVIDVRPFKARGPLRFVNTNRLLKNGGWSIELGKTGYLNEAGRCLMMRADIAGRTLNIVLLDSFGKLTPFGDSNRLRRWIEQGLLQESANSSADAIPPTEG